MNYFICNHKTITMNRSQDEIFLCKLSRFGLFAQTKNEMRTEINVLFIVRLACRKKLHISFPLRLCKIDLKKKDFRVTAQNSLSTIEIAKKASAT